MIFADRLRRNELYEMQFFRADDWEWFVLEPGVAELIRNLENKERCTIHSRNDLVTCLNRIHEDLLEDASIATEKTAVPLLMPMELWIIDQHRAIFSIPSYVDLESQHGFHTRDRDLIGGLVSVWKRYKEEKKL
jgi:hypothetical protein